ncbi:MAG: hypothetical protein IPP74_14310 [Alphaproteobacteria bacterium]|nr:hypothetical protein [Alphaproteobacteria bacterium]
MDGIDLSWFASIHPELYGLLGTVLIGCKRIFPLIRKNIEIKQSTLDCLIRIENLTKESIAITQENNRIIKTLATKDDMINVLLKKEPALAVLNSSGSIAKQGIS